MKGLLGYTDLSQYMKNLKLYLIVFLRPLQIPPHPPVLHQ